MAEAPDKPGQAMGYRRAGMKPVHGSNRVHKTDILETHGLSCVYVMNMTASTHGFSHGNEERMPTIHNLIPGTNSPRL